MPSDNSEIIIYQTEDGRAKINVRMEDENVWLTQAQMVELFLSSKPNISEHIRHIFEEGELTEESVVRNFRTTAADGKNYSTKHYSLDVIISVGYRVKSLRGTQFRRWATAVLREYLVKGFAMNDDLLKKAGGGDYWYELCLPWVRRLLACDSGRQDACRPRCRLEACDPRERDFATALTPKYERVASHLSFIICHL